MLEGIQQSLQSLQNQYHRLDQLAQSMTNLGTPGYRATDCGLRDGEFSSWIRRSQGPVQASTGTLDVALPQGGYFEVQASGGSRAYTSRGDLRLDDQQRLTTGAGDLVLDDSHQEIHLSNGPVSIGAQGEVLQGRQVVAHLGRYRLDVPAPLKGEQQIGGTLYGGPADMNPQLDNRPLELGQLEGSNLDPAEEQARNLDIQQRASLLSQAVTVQDKSFDQSLQDLGRSH